MGYEKVESLSVVCGKKWNRLKLTHIHYGRLMGIDKKWTRGETSDSVGEYDLA